jgi:hypothetical protein
VRRCGDAGSGSHAPCSPRPPRCRVSEHAKGGVDRSPASAETARGVWNPTGRSCRAILSR